VEHLDGVLSQVDRAVGRRREADGTPGIALALTDRDRLLAVRTYGFANAAAQVPVTPETLFEIGSIGKAFTAVALLRLREAGRVDLQAPVTEYLPWFEVGGTRAPITLHHLLTHTAGIVSGMDGTPAAASEVWALRRTQVGGPPGERFHYSNVGYKTLGLVIESVTGAAYGETVRELLALVGMDESEPTITHDTRHRLAVGYVPWYDDRPSLRRHPLAPATWLETDTADGSIAATAGDLAAFLRMLLNRGDGPRGRVLSGESFALMTRAVPAWGGGYGYGLSVWEDGGTTEIGHPGGMVGYVASMRGGLDAGLGVVVLCNGPGSPDDLGRAALALLRAADGRAAAPEEEAAAAIPVDDFTGSYAGPEHRFSIVGAGDELSLQRGAEEARLEHRWDDDFVVDHPAFAQFPLRFERDGEGDVVGATHGGDRYAKEGLAQEAAAALPATWAAFPGRYRSFSPWVPTFVVLPRGGRLWLVFPGGDPDGFMEEQPLVPLGDGSFRAGDDPAGPERITFDALVEGRALRATLSGTDYWRVADA